MTQETSKIIDLKKINFTDIFQYDIFEKIKNQAYYYILNKDLDGSAIFANDLEHLVEGYAPSTVEQKKFLEVIWFWILRLKLLSFSNFELREQVDLIKTTLVQAFKFNLDFKKAIYDFIDLFESGSVIMEIVKTYINAVLSSDIYLGSEEVFKKEKFVPTVSNWIKQYQEVINTGNFNNQPGAFSQVKFFNSNPLIKSLTSEEKKVLKQLIDLYNWLLNPVVYVNDSKEIKIYNNINSESDASASGINVIKKDAYVVSSPPQVPAPKNAPQVVPMEEVSSSPAAVMPPLTVKKQGPVQGYVMGAKNSNIQDLLKSSAQDYESRGLRMGSNPSSLISDPLPKAQTSNPSSLNVNPLPGDAGIKKQNSKEQEINKKLEDLGQRVKK